MPSVRGLALRAYNGFNKLTARWLLPKAVRFHSDGLRLEPLGSGDGTWIVSAILFIKI